MIFIDNGNRIVHVHFHFLKKLRSVCNFTIKDGKRFVRLGLEQPLCSQGFGISDQEDFKMRTNKF